MAQFNNKDQRNLEELLEEKWVDRFKARGAEALGSAKGLGQQLKGGFQQAAGSALTMVDKEKGRELSQRGQRSAGEGMVSGHNAKVQYLQKNIDKRIQSFVDDIKNDIKKLGLDIGNIEIISGINDALGQLKKSVSGATSSPSPQQSGATPPPLPQQSGATPPQQVDDDNGDFKYDANFGDDVDGVSTIPTKKSQKNFNYKGKGFDQQTDLSNPSNMIYNQGKVNYDDTPKPVQKPKQQRGTKYLNMNSKQQRGTKYLNPKSPTKTNPRFKKKKAQQDEENLDKMFWEP